MNRLYTSDDFSVSCTSESDDGLSSDEEDTRNVSIENNTSKSYGPQVPIKQSKSQNILLKLQIREVLFYKLINYFPMESDNLFIFLTENGIFLG